LLINSKSYQYRWWYGLNVLFTANIFATRKALWLYHFITLNPSMNATKITWKISWRKFAVIASSILVTECNALHSKHIFPFCSICYWIVHQNLLLLQCKFYNNNVKIKINLKKINCNTITYIRIIKFKLHSLNLII